MSALDEMIANEIATWEGEALPHPSGSTSRSKRARAARDELKVLRARLAAADALAEVVQRELPCLFGGYSEEEIERFRKKHHPNGSKTSAWIHLRDALAAYRSASNG